MCRRLAYLVAGLLVLLAGVSVQAGEWTVDFDTPHDFLADGVEGTGWDGFLGLGPQETVEALNASIERPGELYMSSAGTWSAGWNPLGPFLYKIVEGDFVASVRVTDYVTMAYNNCGLMARLANGDDGGAGEDWVSIDYFPQYGCGNIARSANNNARSEHVGGAGRGTNPHAWMQLERVGNTFYLRTSEDGVTWVDYPNATWAVQVRDDFDGLPVQVGLHRATYTANVSYVAFDDFSLEGPNVSGVAEAYNPNPANEADDVVRDKALSWRAIETAVSHDVYFGMVADDVAAATRDNPLGVQVSQAQPATTYAPAGVLAYGQTYYWRVDEVEADGTIRTGKLWQFTVEPEFYPVENIAATASDSDQDSGPENTIDGSGLNTTDQHSDADEDMWQVTLPTDGATSVWIQYEFDKVYKLYDMLVWNANVQFELYLNFSVKDVTIEYSVDANDWMPLGDYTFQKGTGLPNYTANTTIDFGGVLAKYVRISVNSTYGGAKASLSEVRFLYKPGTAREPQPASGANNVDPDVVLSWRPGREADLHQVYVGTDSNAVAEDTVPVATVTDASYAPQSLELAQTYYWRVDEVNEAETPTLWEGDLWSFSTPEYFVVDNFESYNDEEGNLIYESWADGFGIPGNGSQVGHSNPPYAERSTVHSGSQAMPLSYGLEGATTSEATLTLAGSEDWTRGGAQALVLYIRGNLNNAAGQVYVKINGTQVYSGSPTLTAPIWQPLVIDLAAAGNAARNVSTLMIGVTSSGEGLLYVDDVRLYRVPPAMLEPAVNPGTANLVAHYTMENSVADTSGHGYDGTAQTGASFGDGPTGYGRALVLDGTSGYADLAIGSLVQTLSSGTVALWVNWAGSGGAWQRAFDFGTGTDAYMFLTPSGASSLRFAITVEGGGNESQLNAPALSTGWHHVAVAIDGAALQMQMYLDGTQVDAGPTEVLPSDLGATTQNWIGRSQYDGDAYFNGSVDDVRIYNRALSGPEIRYLVGDR